MQKSEQDLIQTFNHTLTSMTFIIEALTKRVNEAENELAFAKENWDNQRKAFRNKCAEVDAQKEVIEKLQNENEELNGKLANARHQLSVYENEV